jgi:hypothetical protein
MVLLKKKKGFGNSTYSLIFLEQNSNNKQENEAENFLPPKKELFDLT